LYVRNGRACDLSGATWVREFAAHKLTSASPRSVLITQGDQDRFPIWYVHDVLGIRPDVIPIDRGYLSDAWSDLGRDSSQWYLHRLRRQGVNAPLAIPADPAAHRRLADDGYLVRLLDHQLRDRPVCLTFASTGGTPRQDRRVYFRWAQPRYEMLPQGIVLALHPRNQPVDLKDLLNRNEALWSRIKLPDLRGVRTDQDRDPDYVKNHYACMLVNFGGLYEMAGAMTRAEEVLRRASQEYPHYEPAAASLASVRRQLSLRRPPDVASRPMKRS
jgi:hypothetical protein